MALDDPPDGKIDQWRVQRDAQASQLQPLAVKGTSKAIVLVRSDFLGFNLYDMLICIRLIGTDYMTDDSI